MQSPDETAMRSALRSLSGQRAFVVGYSGAVGGELVKRLRSANVFGQLVLIGRSEPASIDGVDRVKFVKVPDLGNLHEHASAFAHCQVGYCCLGTTRAKSGKDGFYKVDHDYVVKCAELAQAQGCAQYHMVTATGANEHSWFLELRTKGEAERDCAKLGLPSLSVYRPYFVQTERAGRPALQRAALAAIGPIAAVSVPAASVAKAMLYNTVVRRAAANGGRGADGTAAPSTVYVTHAQLHQLALQWDNNQQQHD